MLDRASPSSRDSGSAVSQRRADATIDRLAIVRQPLAPLRPWLYDASTGVCRDGLHVEGVNENQREQNRRWRFCSTTSAEAAAERGFRTRLVDREIAFAQWRVVQPGDRARGLFAGAHVHERESAGSSRGGVAHDVDGVDLTRASEQVLRARSHGVKSGVRRWRAVLNYTAATRALGQDDVRAISSRQLC